MPGITSALAQVSYEKLARSVIFSTIPDTIQEFTITKTPDTNTICFDIPQTANHLSIMLSIAKNGTRNATLDNLQLIINDDESRHICMITTTRRFSDGGRAQGSTNLSTLNRWVPLESIPSSIEIPDQRADRHIFIPFYRSNVRKIMYSHPAYFIIAADFVGRMQQRFVAHSATITDAITKLCFRIGGPTNIQPITVDSVIVVQGIA